MTRPRFFPALDMPPELKKAQKYKALAALFCLLISCSKIPLSGSCERFYKKAMGGKPLSPKDIQKLAKGASLCEKGGQPRLSALILERLLRESKKGGAKAREIKKWELSLAALYFYRLGNYEKAIKRYTGLLKRPLGPGERPAIQCKIAESFFRLKKLSQALREAEKCFAEGISMERTKRALALKGRILLAQKRFGPALKLFKGQMERFPKEESFFREYRAFIYEAKGDLPSAIAELEKIKPKSSFTEQKIRRLLNRLSQQPAAF